MISTGFDYFIKLENAYLPSTLGTVGAKVNYDETEQALKDLSRAIDVIDPNNIIDLLTDSTDNSLESEAKLDAFKGILRFLEFTKHLDWLISEEILEKKDARKNLFRKPVKLRSLKELKELTEEVLNKARNFISELFRLDGEPSKIFENFNDPKKSMLRRHYDGLKSFIKAS